ncbi:MAG: patatin-like phospholipase family protein [Hyphomicrobiaceae bacterium]
MISSLRNARFVLGMCAVLAASGCAAISPRNPLPPTLVATAEVPGLPSVRFFADDFPRDVAAALRRHFPNAGRFGSTSTMSGGREVVEVLSLSGGGPNGAFGAGVLVGWTNTGRRPEFEAVTGVSAGALIAPFAFLGPQYDHVLEEIWTAYETKDLIRASIVPGLLGGDSLVDTEPLADLMAHYVDEALLREIASQYRRGRLLLVLTTNLDAQRPVVWNMGEIAAAGSPEGLALFRSVLLASAAIPGAFPPVRVRVKADGNIYDELHVDGGTSRQILVSPLEAPIQAFDAFHPRAPIRHIYIIENGKHAPTYKPVGQTTIKIAGRAISTLLLNQTGGELYRVYRRVKDAGAAFHYLSIPVEFPYEPAEVFDRGYQTKLFEAGRAIGASGRRWMDRPPELVPSELRPQPAETRPVPRPDGPAVFVADTFFAEVR